MQDLRARLEPVLRGGVGGQVLREAEGQPEEVLERVLVLVARHAPEGRVLARRAADRGGDLNLRGEPLDDLAALLAGELALVLGWHLPVGQGREDVHPAVHVVAVNEVGIERVDAQTALLPVRAVTAETGRRQNGLDALERREFGRPRMLRAIPRALRPLRLERVEVRAVRDRRLVRLLRAGTLHDQAERGDQQEAGKEADAEDEVEGSRVGVHRVGPRGGRGDQRIRA